MAFMLAILAMAAAAGVLGAITGLAIGIEAERKRRPPAPKKEDDKCED